MIKPLLHAAFIALVTWIAFLLPAYGGYEVLAAGKNNPPARPGALLAEAITLSADSVAGMPDTEVVVPVRVAGFNSIITGQGTITFDPAVASFVGVEQYGLPGMGSANFGTTQAASGKIIFSWDDATLAGKTLADNSVVFAIRYKVVGTYGASSTVAFGNSPAPLEFVDKDFVLAQLTLKSGKVQVPDLSITTSALSSNNLCAGSNVSVAFTTKGTFAAGNTFTAQLSDASGSFASPTAIGTGTASPIAATIPAGAQGVGYRIRVIASSPAITGTDNGSNITIDASPAAPGVTPAERCGPGSVTLSASGAPTAGSYRWYTAASGGTAISGATGASYTTPDLTTTTVYYVSAASSSGCEGPREAVSATIHALPGAPTVTNGESCGSGTVTLTAGGAPTGGSYRWYTVAAGGTAISGATGASYTTPALTATTTYYVSAVSSAACESSRTPVTATVKAAPAMPVASASPAQVGGTLRLSASTVTGATYSWSGPNGFTATGQYPAIAKATTAHSGTYSVVATINGCSSGADTVNVKVVEVPPVTFDADSVSGLQNAEVVVPVRVKGFTNIVSKQYSVNWDATVATFVGVEAFGLSSLTAANFGASQVATGKLMLSWNDASLAAHTLADSTILFSLRLKLSGAMGQTTPVTITDNPTPVEVSEKNGFLVPVTSVAGAATIRKPVKISGKIKSEQGAGVRTVTVTATGGTGPLPFETKPDGLYEFDVMQDGTYTVSPFKNNDAEAYNGITTLDIALIRRHILNITALGSPYKLLAADADNSSAITTTDIASVRKVILTIDSYFPGKRLWRFVPQSFTFPDPKNPFPFKDSVQVHANIVQEKTGQDFIGVKIGDVNNTWDATRAKTVTAGDLLVQLHDQQVVPGTEVLVPLKVYDFDAVSGYQFTLNWDPQVLEFVAVEDAAAQGAFGIHRVAEGKLTTAWDDPAGKSLSLPQGSSIFNVKFKAVGALNTQTEVAINSALTRSIAYNQDLDQLNVVPGNARVRLRSTAGPVMSGYALYQNAPNPLSPAGTVIRFSIPQTEQVSITIYNSLGQLVRTFRDTYAAGEHALRWDGSNHQGHRLSGGTYFYRMQAGSFSEAKRALIR